MDVMQVSSKTKVQNELIGLQTQLTKPEQLLLAGTLLLVEDQAKEDDVEGHMLPTLSSFDLAQRHQGELLREAEYIHAVKEAEAGKPSFWDRTKISLGEFMVTAGRRLAARPIVKRSTAA